MSKNSCLPAMFSLFKSDPTKKLRKQYEEKLEQAMQAQRNGDIQTYSMLTAEAEQILVKVDSIESSTDS